MIANPFAEATARALLDAVAAGSRQCPAMVFGDERVPFARFGQRVENRSWSVFRTRGATKRRSHT